MEHMDGLEVTGCQRCPELLTSRSQIVNGTGAEETEVVFVGEAPGEREDELGDPFVGRSGTVLDDALRNGGLSRSDVRITNCVRCRPPDNRDPKTGELENCRSYLEREIALIDPAVIVTLGKVPGEHLLDREVAVTNEVGSLETVTIADEPRRVLISVHPAATLYDRSQREGFEDAIETAADFATDGGQVQLSDF